MTQPVVVVSTRSFGSGEQDPQALLEAAGCRVELVAPSHDLAVIGDALRGAHGWIAGTAPVTAEHLAAAPALRIVARYGVGVDAVDLRAAAARGVVVTNTPGANAEAVADHTMALALAALRDVVAGDRAVRAGDWSRRPGRELGSCRVGVVGYGTIGRAVRRRLVGFGCEVVAHDPYVREADVPLVRLEELVSSCDVVTLHLPGGGLPLVDAALLALFRPGAVLVNTARGDLLDEQAVARALVEGRLGACAVDVLSAELGRGPSPLLDAPRVTVTPHVAGQTVQAIDRMGMTAAAECVRVLVEGRPPQHPVQLQEAEQ